MRDQALVTKLLDVDITVYNEDTNLSDIDRVALISKHLVTVVLCRLHTVTANRDHEVSLFCFCTLENEKFLCQIAIKNVPVPAEAGRVTKSIFSIRDLFFVTIRLKVQIPPDVMLLLFFI